MAFRVSDAEFQSWVEKGLIPSDEPAVTVDPLIQTYQSDLPPVERSEVACIEIPPSVNNLFINRGRKRVKSPKYRAWIERNAMSLGLQLSKPTAFPVRLVITILGGKGFRRNRDVSNCIKAIEDAVVWSGVIPNDSIKFIHAVHANYIERKTREPAKCLVRLEGSK